MTTNLAKSDDEDKLIGQLSVQFADYKLHNEDINTLIRKILSEDVQLDEKTHCFDNLHQLFLIEKETVIADMVQMNILPSFANFLSYDNEMILQFKCLLIMTFFTSGTEKEAKEVINSGALPHFIDLIDSPEDCIVEQALLCVGNLACDSPYIRYMLYEKGALNSIIRYIKKNRGCAEYLKTSSWALTNMCRCRTSIELNNYKECLKAIEILMESLDEEIILESCISSSYLTDGPNDRIQIFIESGLAPAISNFILHPSKYVVHASIRTLCNLVSGTNEQTKAMLELGVAGKLVYVIRYNKEHCIVREACQSLSNITAGTKDDIKIVIEEGAIPILIKLAKCGEEDIRVEAIWALSNAIVACGHELINHFLSPEIIKILCNVLKMQNPNLIKVALRCIRNILWCGDYGEDPFFDISCWEPESDEAFWAHADWLLDCKGFSLLGKLRYHPDIEISQDVLELLSILTENPHAEISESESDEGDDDGDDDDEKIDEMEFEHNISFTSVKSIIRN